MQSFWALIQILVGLTGSLDPAAVDKLAGTHLEQVNENEYVRFYESKIPLQLDADKGKRVVTGTLDVRVSKDPSRPSSVFLTDLKGACIRLEEVKLHVSDLTFPRPPNHPFPDAPISREGKLDGKPVNLTSKWSTPDCLESISPARD